MTNEGKSCQWKNQFCSLKYEYKISSLVPKCGSFSTLFFRNSDSRLLKNRSNNPNSYDPNPNSIPIHDFETNLNFLKTLFALNRPGKKKYAYRQRMRFSIAESLPMFPSCDHIFYLFSLPSRSLNSSQGTRQISFTNRSMKVVNFLSISGTVVLANFTYNCRWYPVLRWICRSLSSKHRWEVPSITSMLPLSSIVSVCMT